MNTSRLAPHVLGVMLVAFLVTAEQLWAQGWNYMQFSGTESFSYAIRHTTPEGEQVGTYTMALQPAGGQTMATIQASLGDASCQTTAPMATPQAFPQMMIMQCLPMAPVIAAMFAPSWMMFMGQVWEVGSQMTFGQGGNRVSFSITETCGYAGVDGVRGVFDSGDGVTMEACVANDVPLPLAVRMVNEKSGDDIEATLTRYAR